VGPLFKKWGVGGPEGFKPEIEFGTSIGYCDTTYDWCIYYIQL